MADFADRLKTLRTDMKFYQKELADKVGFPRSTIAAWESGNRTPEMASAQKLADFFGVNIDYLLGRTDDPRTIDQINKDNAQRISDALASDPESEELLAFWNELKEREDLFLLFKQVRPLSDDSIRRVMRVIKAIEDEESGQSH